MVKMVWLCMLNSLMATLGMPDTFDEEKADFGAFCDWSTFIGLMKQVAKSQYYGE